MSAAIGVTTLNGLSVPSGAYAQESSLEQSVDIATVRDATGNVVKATAKKLITKTATLRVKGGAALSLVTSGSVGTSIKVTSVKNMESSGDYPEAEITGTFFATRS